MPNRRFNTQVTNPMKAGGRVKKRGGECLLLEKTWHLVTIKMTWE